METLSALLGLCGWNVLMTSGFLLQMSNNAKFDILIDVSRNKLFTKSNWLVIYDANMLIWRHCNVKI